MPNNGTSVLWYFYEEKKKKIGFLRFPPTTNGEEHIWK